MSEYEHDDILDTFETPEASGSQVYTFETDELTAVCPFDFGGPDFYDLVIRYVPGDVALESKSLKKYVEAHRNREITVEALIGEIHDALDAAASPERLYVRGEQARRGGIEETVELGDRSLARDPWAGGGE